MNKHFINIIPSFLLRGINPLDVLDKYYKGNYASLTRKKLKTAIKISTISFVPVNSESTDEAFYTFKDKNGYNQLIVFSNQREYQAFIKGETITHRCNMCFKEFTYEPERIPLHFEERYLQIPDSKDQTRVKVNLVWGEGTFCCPDECFTAIRRNSDLRYRYRDPLMSNSEIIYRNICAERFPNHKLKEVDLRYMSVLGGSIEDKPKDSYKRLNSFVVVPVKVPYERIQSS